jgi:hypothetical protein
MGNLREFLGQKGYHRDYAKVYEVPPLSECAQKSPLKACGDKGCCPVPSTSYAPHHHQLENGEAGKTDGPSRCAEGQHQHQHQHQQQCCQATEGEHQHVPQPTEGGIGAAEQGQGERESNMV